MTECHGCLVRQGFPAKLRHVMTLGRVWWWAQNWAQFFEQQRFVPRRNPLRLSMGYPHPRVSCTCPPAFRKKCEKLPKKYSPSPSSPERPKRFHSGLRFWDCIVNKTSAVRSGAKTSTRQGPAATMIPPPDISDGDTTICGVTMNGE